MGAQDAHSDEKLQDGNPGQKLLQPWNKKVFLNPSRGIPHGVDCLGNLDASVVYLETP